MKSQVLLIQEGKYIKEEIYKGVSYEMLKELREWGKRSIKFTSNKALNIKVTEKEGKKSI